MTIASTPVAKNPLEEMEQPLYGHGEDTGPSVQVRSAAEREMRGTSKAE